MANSYIITLKSDKDTAGIVYDFTKAILNAGANIDEANQFHSFSSDAFYLRSEVFCDSFEKLQKSLSFLKNKYKISIYHKNEKINTLLLVSKELHCALDLLYRAHAGQLNINIKAIVSNHSAVSSWADFYKIPFIYSPITHAGDKAECEAKILQFVEKENIELVILAKYMQILSPVFCDILQEKVINIHHSFLPSFKGANPYKKAWDRGVKIIGATSHFITKDLDEGPIIAQNVTRCDHSLKWQDLKKIGQDLEIITLREAVEKFADKKIFLDGIKTIVF